MHTSASAEAKSVSSAPARRRHNRESRRNRFRTTKCRIVRESNLISEFSVLSSQFSVKTWVFRTENREPRTENYLAPHSLFQIRARPGRRYEPGGSPRRAFRLSSAQRLSGKHVVRVARR